MSRPPGASSVPAAWSPFAALDLVNSEFADHTGGGGRVDRLGREQWQRALLRHWGWSAPVPAPPPAHRALRSLRPLLRRVLLAGSLEPADENALNRLLRAAPFTQRLGPGLRVSRLPERANWSSVAAELALSAVEALAAGSDRIRECANPACSWMFYDQTLNRSRRWCHVGVCGSLVRVRRHRAARGA